MSLLGEALIHKVSVVSSNVCVLVLLIRRSLLITGEARHIALSLCILECGLLRLSEAKSLDIENPLIKG